MKCSGEICLGLRFGVFEVDLVRQELRKHGIRIKLPSQPFQALVKLLEAKGKVVTREELRNALWPDQPWGDLDQRLNSIINKIREALCDSADVPHFLETLPRVGYRFLATVERIIETPTEDDSITVLPQDPARAPPPVSVPASSPEARPAFRLWQVLTAAVSLLGLGAAFEYHVAARIHASGSPVPIPLTTYVGSELYPSFSPDGQQVVFAANGDQEQKLHIFITPVSGGSGARRITGGPQNDSAPVWSRDGKQIAFLRESGERRVEIWLIRPDGTQIRRVTEIPRADTDHPLSWTKDSGWLIAAVGSTSGGPSSLHLISTGSGTEYGPQSDGIA